MDYFANKALEKVTNDESLAEAPQSERMSKLEAALRPFGNRGMDMLQRQLGIEQKREQEQEKIKQENILNKKAPVIAKALRNEPLTKEEEGLLFPDEQIAIAKHKQAVNKPVGGVSAQAIPQEIANSIPNILNENPDANSDQLALAFDNAGIPRAYSNSYIENRRRQDEAKSKAIPEAYKETREERKKILEQHKAYQDTKLRLDRMETLNNEGKLTTPLMSKTLDELGLPIGILGNPDTEEFQKLSQDLFKNIQSIFGNRILKIEVDNFAKTIPTLNNSKEGRQRIINNMRLLGEGQKLSYDAYKEVMKGREYPPLDLMEKIDEKVSEKLDDLAERFKEVNKKKTNIPEGNIKVRAPNGILGSIPKENLEAAKAAGYVIVE